MARARRRAGRIVLWTVAIVLVLACTSSRSAFIYGPLAGVAVRPISDRLFYPWEAIHVAWDGIFHREAFAAQRCAELMRYRPAAWSTPIAHVEIPQHPFMASNGGNNMHCDAYMSDAYEAAGPIGVGTVVRSRTQGFGGYGTVATDSAGRLVAVYSNGRGFQLELMDPFTLEELASHDLPGRPWTWPLGGIMPWEYIGAGMYFYLDEQDRAIVPTTRNTIQIVQLPGSPDDDFKLEREINLSDHVVPMRWPHRDSVAWVLPDWGGKVYWFATTGGVVGTVGVESEAVYTLRLDGEIIENSFAVAEDGVYILSDRALYRFSQDGTGTIAVDWRTPYDRGPGKKPGHITRGSGTSVSLVGDENGLAVITDNAEPRIHVIFVRRIDGSVACSAPLFAEGMSGTDISAACFEHADEDGRGTGVYSALIENNWGHHTFPRSRPEPGLTRVDAVRYADGSVTCREIWTSPVKGICVFKLSFGSGLAYTYWRSETCRPTTWILTAIDFATGETVFEQQVGTGLGFDNWAGALFLHPDDGILYSTTLFGLVMIRDEPP